MKKKNATLNNKPKIEKKIWNENECTQFGKVSDG